MIDSQLLYSNKKDRESLLNLLKTYVFGNDGINKFDPSETYNTGDFVYRIDEMTNRISFLEALIDGINGPFNPNEWEIKDLAAVINAAINDVIILSTYKPTPKINRLWVQPIEYGYHTLPQPVPIYDGDKYSMLFTGEIPIVDEVTDSLTKALKEEDILLDTEGEYSLEIDQELIDMFRDGGMIIIDEQEDVDVSTTEPNNNRHLTWFDTDVTDED